MASTYSNLKFELIGTGDQSGAWGTTTNTNLGTAIEQALVGMATISSGFVTNSLTLTLTDTNAAQNARALVLNLTQALSGAGTLNVPAIQKPYMIINATGQTVTVKVTGLTGVAVPTGTRAFLYNNGTDVGAFFNYAPSLTLGTDLAVADGGTGASDAATARTNLGATTVGSNLFTLTNPSAITFLRINADNTVSALDAATFRTAIGAGTGSGSVSSVSGTGTVQGLSLSGTVTTTGSLTLGGSLSAVSLTTQVSGTLPVGNGGTGITSFGSGVATWLGTPSSANLASAVTDETGSGALVFATSPTLVTPVLGTPTSGTLSNCTVDGTDSVGFRNIPQNVQTGNYTLVLADAGKHIYRASGGAATWTIPAASSVAYPIGTALTFINLSATAVSIAITTDTMYLSSAGTTGTRTLAQYGSATAVKVSGLSSSGNWVISGSGLT